MGAQKETVTMAASMTEISAQADLCDQTDSEITSC